MAHRVANQWKLNCIHGNKTKAEGSNQPKRREGGFASEKYHRLFERVQCNLKTKGFCNIGWREGEAQQPGHFGSRC